MGQHHPFRLPGRAGGIHDGRQVMRLNIIGAPVKIAVALEISTCRFGIGHEIAKPYGLCYVISVIHDHNAFNLGQVSERGNFFVLLRRRNNDNARTGIRQNCGNLLRR